MEEMLFLTNLTKNTKIGNWEYQMKIILTLPKK